MKPADSSDGMNPSQRIDNQIAELTDWRGPMLAKLRQVVLGADPEITEEWKWGSAVWTKKGLICSGGVFKDHVKMHFFKGASLEDPQGLFNVGLEAKAMRAIDFSQGDQVDEPALKDLIRAAVAYNTTGGKKK